MVFVLKRTMVTLNVTLMNGLNAVGVISGYIQLVVANVVTYNFVIFVESIFA